MIAIDSTTIEDELKLARLLNYIEPNLGITVYTEVFAIEGKQLWSNEDKET